MKVRTERMSAAGGPLRTSFALSAGSRVDPTDPIGYYIDLTAKAQSSDWHRAPAPTAENDRSWVVVIQWGLGCFERFLAGEGDNWLVAARKTADFLLDNQVQTGSKVGAWVHAKRYRHTYATGEAWISGMAQGQAASLLVRMHRESGGDRYAHGATLAVQPLFESVESGGAAADLTGGLFPQEFPTTPPAHVLNGGIFGLWGLHDVGVALEDERARSGWAEGRAALAESLDRFDTGRWSTYDLYPHPIVNVAHVAYHRLHIEQLRIMALLTGDERFVHRAQRFEGYEASRLNQAIAIARKVAFRVLVPRNRALAHRLHWAPRQRS